MQITLKSKSISQVVLITKNYFSKGELTKEQQHKLDVIKKTLTVDKKETKAAKRKKISAPDPRPTAKAVGATLGIGLLVLLFAMIVLPDIPVIINDIRFGPRRGGRRKT